MNVVETHDLTKIFQTGMKKGNVVALDSVSIEIGPGEIFGLLGPNGAGKTTLVKVLLGIVRATSGESLVNGLPPTDPASREKVGFLPENHRFPLHLTGTGLLELAGRMYGMNGAEISQKVSGLLQLVGMERWGSTKINRYSKGMAQRIGLAQALISDPDLLLLDEPTDGVDPVGKSEIKTVLNRIREQGKSILLNSHLLSEVELVADRVAILNKGKVLRTGGIDEFTTKGLRYEIEASIGNERIEVPEDIGRVIALRTNGMTVELSHVDHLNTIIDRLRLKRISIKSIQPTRISLEQSFLEALEEGDGLSI